MQNKALMQLKEPEHAMISPAICTATISMLAISRNKLPWLGGRAHCLKHGNIQEQLAKEASLTSMIGGTHLGVPLRVRSKPFNARADLERRRQIGVDGDI